MSPHRTMPEPCRECARRDAEEAETQRRLAERLAARPRKPFDWGLFALIGLFVALFGFVLFAGLDSAPSETPPTCYRVVDDNENGVQLQRTKYHRWTEPSWKSVQVFVSRAEAEAFVVAKQVRMCR
jgi:hypothetical protein